MKKSICEMDENSKNKRLHYNLFRYNTNKHKSNKRINMFHVLSHVFLEYKSLFPFMKTNLTCECHFQQNNFKKVRQQDESSKQQSFMETNKYPY